MAKDKAKATTKKAAAKKPTASKKVSVKDLTSKRDVLQAKSEKLYTDLDKNLIPANEVAEARKTLNKTVNDIVKLNDSISKANG